MTEDQVVGEIVAEADKLGVMWYHPNQSQRDRRGFPDLVLAGPGGVEFWEVKMPNGSMSVDQWSWAHALLAGGAVHRVVWLRDWQNGTVSSWLRVLSTPRPHPADGF